MNARARTALVAIALLVFVGAAARAWQTRNASRARRPLAKQATSVVLAWGCNAHGELGVVPPNTHVPSVVNGLPPVVVALAAGFGHSLAIDDKGNIWAWGDNDLGQLGNGSRASYLLPTKLATPTHVKAVAAGAGHSLALLEDGTVWAWGDNRDGELGVEDRADSDTPLQVKGLSNVEAIAAGGRHSLALLHDGGVKVWGTNGYGQLCNGTNQGSSSPISLEPPLGEKAPPRFTAIAAGRYHTLALDQTGHAWSCGWNVFGQLGNDSFTQPKEGERRLVPVVGLDEVTALAAGHLHSVALRLHQAIAGAKNGGVGPGVSPKTALALGLKVDATAIPAKTAAAIKAGKVNLDDPAVTLTLLKLNAVVGIKGFFNSSGQLTSMGTTCALLPLDGRRLVCSRDRQATRRLAEP